MKEINFLSCTTLKDQILDMYLAVISKEKAKLQAKTAKRAQAQVTCDSESDNSIELIAQKVKAKKAKKAKFFSDSDSDSEVSMAVIEQTIPKKKKKTTFIIEEQPIPDDGKMAEEIAFLKSIHALDSEESVVET